MEEGEALEVLRVGCGAPKSLELPRSEVFQVTILVADRFELRQLVPMHSCLSFFETAAR